MRIRNYKLEAKIVKFLKAGYSYRNIAGHLKISVGNVSRVAKLYNLQTTNKIQLEGYLWEFACKKYLIENNPISDLQFKAFMFEKGKRYSPDAFLKKQNKAIEFKINCADGTIAKKIPHYLSFADTVEFWFRYGNFSEQIMKSRNQIYQLQKEYPKRIVFKDMSELIRI